MAMNSRTDRRTYQRVRLAENAPVVPSYVPIVPPIRKNGKTSMKSTRTAGTISY